MILGSAVTKGELSFCNITFRLRGQAWPKATGCVIDFFSETICTQWGRVRWLYTGVLLDWATLWFLMSYSSSQMHSKSSKSDQHQTLWRSWRSRMHVALCKLLCTPEVPFLLFQLVSTLRCWITWVVSAQYFVFVVWCAFLIVCLDADYDGLLRRCL